MYVIVYANTKIRTINITVKKNSSIKLKALATNNLATSYNLFF